MAEYPVDVVFFYILKKSKCNASKAIYVQDIKSKFDLTKGAVAQRLEKLYKYGSVARTKKGTRIKYYSIVSKQKYLKMVNLIRENGNIRKSGKDDNICHPLMDLFIFGGNKDLITKNLHY